MWQQRFDTRLNSRRADRVLYLVIVIHLGVHPANR